MVKQDVGLAIALTQSAHTSVFVMKVSSSANQSVDA